MGKKKNQKLNFYSTNPNAVWNDDKEEKSTLDPQDQVLRVRMEKKHRGGKKAMVIVGFIGREEDLTELSRILKKHMGVGGSCKDGEIIIQGDQIDKLLSKLNTLGYRNVKKSGG